MGSVQSEFCLSVYGFRSQSTAIVMLGQPVNLTALFPEQAVNQYLVHIPLLVNDTNSSSICRLRRRMTIDIFS